MKRSISVKERLDLGRYGHVDHDTLLSPDRAEERATRIPRSTIRPVATPPPPDTERLLHEFKHDCLTELLIDEHPKGNAAFAMAYRLSDGDLGVTFNLLSEISTLMVPRDPITSQMKREQLILQTMTPLQLGHAKRLIAREITRRSSAPPKKGSRPRGRSSSRAVSASA